MLNPLFSIYGRLLKVFAALIILVAFFGCGSNKQSQDDQTSNNKKTGILLVNHGSRSETWRNALMDLEHKVKDSILQNKKISGIKTAFMEYNEPSIATRLKEFDAEGFTDVVLVPVFLTVSPHTFDDIPTIIGQKDDAKSLETLKIEKIERYKPKAAVHIAPNLDFTDILKKNVLARAKELSVNPQAEGLVLIGYGDETYEKEWGQLFDNVADFVKQNTGIAEHAYGWCGHIAQYKPEKTTEAIETVLKKKEKAIVIPVLVAFDETFQIKIIGGGINKITQSNEKVAYKPDAILPDNNVQQWIINICNQYVEKI